MSSQHGVLKMTAWLRENGYLVNCKRVRRLLRLMGLEAIYQKPRLSITTPGHQVYAYLLRGVKVARVNQVWSHDITYIRLLGGFGYLVAKRLWRSVKYEEVYLHDYQNAPEAIAGLGRYFSFYNVSTL